MQNTTKKPEHIKNAVDYITRIIQVSAWLSTPNIKENKTSCSYPAYVLQKIKQKREAKYKWQRHKTEENKRQLNALTRKFKIMIKEYCNSEFSKYFLNLTPNEDTNYSLWKATKKLKSILAKKIFGKEKYLAKTSMEQATTFVNHLYQTF